MTDPQTAADAAEVAEAVECVQTYLNGVDRVAKDHGGQGYVFSPEDIVLHDAMRTLLKERARMAAELEQVRAAKAADVSDYDAALLAIHEARDYWQAQTVAEWERAEQLRDAVTVAAELIDRLADDAACEADGDGQCRAYGFHIPQVESAPCPHPLGRRFVEAWRTVQTEAPERSDAEGAGKGPESHGDATGVEGTPQRTWTTPEAPQGPPEGDDASGACEWCNLDTHRMGELCNCGRFCGSMNCEAPGEVAPELVELFQRPRVTPPTDEATSGRG